MHITDKELEDISIEELQDTSAVKITGEIAWEHAEKERDAAVKHLGKDAKIDGFRPGNIPEKALVAHIGEGALHHEMATRAISKLYPEIVRAKEIDALGYPQLTLTKLASDNPIGFTAEQQVMPKLTLPDYKAIAAEVNKDKESVEVTDEDVENQINEVLRQKASYERMQKLAALQEDESKKEEAKEIAESELEIPELTDEFVKTLGKEGQFENVEDFKAKIREHLEIQKKQEAESKHKAALQDAILEKTEGSVPEVLIESEINQQFAQMEQDIQNAGLQMEDYLKHVGKTKEDLAKEWRDSAEKRAKFQIVLSEIAKAEDITPDKEKLEEEVKNLKERFADIEEARIRNYVASVLTHEAVMKMLEEAK